VNFTFRFSADPILAAQFNRDNSLFALPRTPDKLGPAQPAASPVFEALQA
jgi:hypothetical protein